MTLAAGSARFVTLAACVAACSRAPSTERATATRIVSLGPATTEGLFAVGAGPRVVGRSSFCDYPPEAARIPAVGGMEPDVEAILALSPDLVVGPSGGWSARLAATLRARGISTWFPDEIQTLAGVDALIMSLAERSGRVEDGRRIVAAVDDGERRVDERVAREPRPRVLLVVGTAPIVAAGPGGFADDLLRRAGAENVVTAGGPWPTLGFERVVELDPDLIVDASGSSAADPPRVTRDATGWSGVRAVREGRVEVVRDERVLRPGPRIAEGLALLEATLHRKP